MISALTRVMGPSCYVVLSLVIMKMLRVLLKASVTSLLVSSTIARSWVVSGSSTMVPRSSIVTSMSIVSISIVVAVCRVVSPLLQVYTLL